MMSYDANVFCRKIETVSISIDNLKNDESDLKLFKVQISSYYKLVNNFLQFLSPQEIIRAEKYHSIKDTNRFIICRTLLKFILSHKLGLSISEIHIEKDENKKPYLSSEKPMHFNVSHAEDFAIIAVSNKAVGVDVEYLNKNFDYSEMLPNVFSSLEIDTLKKSNVKDYTFYKFWTRKEAFVKATGKGISDSLPKIPSMDGYHSITHHLLGDFKSLNVLGFDLNKDYVAALAFDDKSVDFDKLVIYSLPTSIEGLTLFID